jgi:phosphate/sulfate permease
MKAYVLCCLLLLLAQPVLCIAHCYRFPGSASHGTASGVGQFVCLMEAMPVAQGEHIVVPAFWPGVLPLVALWIASLLLVLQRLPLFVPRLASLRWQPTPPPPR